MPTDPTRPSFTPAQRRLLTAVAGLVVAALAGAAFALTYDVLRDLARLGGTGRRWAPLYPAIADALTALTIFSLVITRNARWWTRLLRWTLLILLVGGGAALSVQDSVRGLGELPRDSVRVGVAVAPHVTLVIAVWLWLTMFRQLRLRRPAAEEEPAADEQRGHVKVLEPAEPPSGPLALEAGASEGEAEPLIPFVPEAAADEDDDFEREIFEDDDLPVRGLSSEPAPPLDTLPVPRPPLESAPPFLPTDVELVRSRDRDERPRAATTRPDIPMRARRPEDDDAPLDDDPSDDDGNPPPSSNFRSGPTPPAG